MRTQMRTAPILLGGDVKCERGSGGAGGVSLHECMPACFLLSDQLVQDAMETSYEQ